MNTIVLNDYYLHRGFSQEEAERACGVLEDFQNRISKTGLSIETSSVNEMKSYISKLIRTGSNSSENLLALARAAYLAENNDIYIYFTQILERESIVENIRQNTDEVLGPELSESLFGGLKLPPLGAPPEEAWQFTQNLVNTMVKELTEEQCRKALTANAHGIQASAFAREAEYFKNSDRLESYLKEYHKRSVAELQEHADSGKVWFEQKISDEVVDFVRSNREILGGVLEDGKIFWTKIPYDVEKWLKEKDPVKKRYFACHCPMAREVLNIPDQKIPRSWCNCTSGYIQQRFNAIFGEEVAVDLLETVLDNQDRCRFAIHVPTRFL